MLGLKVRTFWQIVIFSFVASSSAYATENCIFSKENISQKQYSDNPAIEVFQWFPKSNEVKGVLSNGHLFSVKHWACHHYGKQAIMLIGPQIASIPRELNKHILQLGKVALSKTEFMLLTNNIANKPFKLADSPITLRIKSKTFDDFYVQTNIIGEVILIEIRLYKSQRLTKHSSGTPTLRGFLRMASPLSRKRCSALGSAEFGVIALGKAQRILAG